MLQTRSSRWVLGPALAAWGLAVVAGLLLLGAHDARPGDPGAPAHRWPADSRIEADPTRPNLLIFLHPRCPCSRASVAELAEALGRGRGRAAVHVVLLRFAATPGGMAGDVERMAGSLPGTRVWDDPGGVESRRFGVATSGHVLLYDGGGVLAFSGGITPARGHCGDNDGRGAILAMLRHGRPDRPTHPVFGCPLAAPPRVPPREQPREADRRD